MAPSLAPPLTPAKPSTDANTDEIPCSTIVNIRKLTVSLNITCDVHGLLTF